MSDVNIPIYQSVAYSEYLRENTTGVRIKIFIENLRPQKRDLA